MTPALSLTANTVGAMLADYCRKGNYEFNRNEKVDVRKMIFVAVTDPLDCSRFTNKKYIDQ